MPDLVNVLNLKWCTEFKLLGLQFDSSLGCMEKNYNSALEEIRKVKNNSVFKNITLTGGITVTKS